MATERRDNNRSTQTGLPILHFYEQFVKTHKKKQRDPQGDNSQSMEMVQLSTASRRRRQRSVFSDRHAGPENSQTPSNPLALSNIVVSDRETRPSHTKSPVSSLTPATSLPQKNSSKTRTSRLQVTSYANKRQDNRVTRSTTRNPNDDSQTKIADTAKRLTMYERSKLRLQEREKNLQKVRDEMMQECTFRPKISKQSPAISKAKHNNATAQGSVDSFSGLSESKGKTVMRKKSSFISSDIRTPDNNTEATTPTTTSTSKQYWQNLQRKQHKRVNPGISASVSKDESCLSKTTSNTTKSFRFEELYQDGVRKARQRPATEKVEREMRRRRLEDEQLKECTFKPKLYWGNKVPTNRRKPLVSASSVTSSRTVKGGHQSLSPRHERAAAPKEKTDKISSQRSSPIPDIGPIPNIKISPIQTGIHPIESVESPALRRTARKDKTMMPPLPVEITTTITSIEAASPLRRLQDWKTRLYSRGGAVSPLRGPMLGVEIDREPEDSPMAPRVIFCGATVGGESAAEQTQRTEYGSI